MDCEITNGFCGGLYSQITSLTQSGFRVMEELVKLEKGRWQEKTGSSGRDRATTYGGVKVAPGETERILFSKNEKTSILENRILLKQIRQPIGQIQSAAFTYDKNEPFKS